MTASSVVLNAGGGGQRLASAVDANGLETLAVNVTGTEALALAQGLIQGHTAVEKFGLNPLINTATDPEDIWNGGGLYTGFPTGAAETLEVFSSDANDTAAGTGARTVIVENMLDANGVPQPNITVALNGATPVSLGAGVYSRAIRVGVLTAGSAESNLGEITLRHTTTTTNVFAVMPVSYNQTTVCGYTVPAGHTLYLDNVQFQMARTGGLAGSANVSLRARPFGGAFRAKISPTITDSQGYTNLDSNYRVFTERTDIVARVESVSDNGTIVSANLGGVLVVN
tara:strand:+ start:12980 stop:13831 length:852 start_codon:yes stop_codon:yes gene_type:complete